MKHLRTDRTIFSFLLPHILANDLNTIIGQADGKITKNRDVGGYEFNQRINLELERRGLGYRISNCFCNKTSNFFMKILLIPMFVEMSQVSSAMNVLAADYNERG